MSTMKSTPSAAKDVDAYIAAFPRDVQQRLAEIRRVIRKAAPDAAEAIKYRMPTFVQNGNLVHFAAYKNHIGFYPAPMSIEEFQKELSQFKGGKGSVQFPLDRPLPLDLIGRIVRFRVREHLEKIQGRAKASKGRKKT